MSVVQESLNVVRVVKAFGQGDREEDRFVRQATRGMRAHIRVTFMQQSFAFLVGLTTTAGTALVLCVGVCHVQSGILILGELLLAGSYITQIFGTTRSIGDRVASLQRSFAGAERAFPLLDEAQDVPERPDARPIERAAGGVAFKDVSFGLM